MQASVQQLRQMKMLLRSNITKILFLDGTVSYAYGTLLVPHDVCWIMYIICFECSYPMVPESFCYSMTDDLRSLTDRTVRGSLWTS